MSQAAADGATARATVVCATVADDGDATELTTNDEIEIAYETAVPAAEGSVLPTVDDATILEYGVLATVAISHGAFEVNDGTDDATAARERPSDPQTVNERKSQT